MKEFNLYSIYRILLRRYGPQGWWPADSVFEVMVGAVLTQNTAWSNVEKALHNLKREKLLQADKLVATRMSYLSKLLKPSGYFNVKAQRLKNLCAWYIKHGKHARLAKMQTAVLRDALLSVNGVGMETADDILLYAFDRPVFVIDAYTRRILGRLGIVDAALGYDALRQDIEKKLCRVRNKVAVFNEYHALLVLHAKDVCRVKPVCADCCLRESCTYGCQ